MDHLVPLIRNQFHNDGLLSSHESNLSYYIDYVSNALDLALTLILLSHFRRWSCRFHLLDTLIIFRRLVFLTILCPFYLYKDYDKNQRKNMLPSFLYFYMYKFWLPCHNLLLYARYSPNYHYLILSTIQRPFHWCNHDLDCKTRNQKYASIAFHYYHTKDKVR